MMSNNKFHLSLVHSDCYNILADIISAKSPLPGGDDVATAEQTSYLISALSVYFTDLMSQKIGNSSAKFHRTEISVASNALLKY